jgi:hypothetical protein
VGVSGSDYTRAPRFGTVASCRSPRPLGVLRRKVRANAGRHAATDVPGNPVAHLPAAGTTRASMRVLGQMRTQSSASQRLGAVNWRFRPPAADATAAPRCSRRYCPPRRRQKRRSGASIGECPEFSNSSYLAPYSAGGSITKTPFRLIFRIICCPAIRCHTVL